MDNFLTVPEAAPIVKMSVQALYSAIRQKQFPHVKIGARRIRIPASALDQWTKDQAAQSVSTEPVETKNE